MRRIDRGRVAAPAVLTQPGRAGEVERRKVLAFYAVAANRGSAFETYGVYRNPEVKQAIETLFNDKCAFCEIDYGGAPWAVEHFRPKGAMDELDLQTMKRAKGAKRVTPGYYWLAAEWCNLLASCTDCNSPRGHRFGGSAVKSTTGKASFFPLQPGSVRAHDPGEGALAAEHPLLLDPTVDDPAAHLCFGDGGTIVALSERGRVTVGVMGLQRDPLVRKRQRERLLLLNLIDSVRAAMARLKADGADAQARAELSVSLKLIREQYLAETAPFLTMSKQLVREGLGAVAGP